MTLSKWSLSTASASNIFCNKSSLNYPHGQVVHKDTIPEVKDAYVNFLTHCYIDTEVDHGGVGVHYLALLKFKSLNILTVADCK